MHGAEYIMHILANQNETQERVERLEVLVAQQEEREAKMAREMEELRALFMRALFMRELRILGEQQQRRQPDGGEGAHPPRGTLRPATM